MEIEFEGEGGVVDMATGKDGQTKLEVYKSPSGQIRIALNATSSHGEMTLGVGLTEKQARDVGGKLLSLARKINDVDEGEDEE